MALNRYSVLPTQQIVNTYVPEDLRYLAGGLERKQKGYDEGLAFDQAAQDKFSQFATRDVDIARKNQLHDEYMQAQQETLAKYDNDYGRAMPALKATAAKFAANPFYEHATNALKRQNDYYEANKRIAEKGGTAINFNDDAVRKAVYNEDGTYNTIDYDTEEQTDWVKARKEALGKIEESGGSAALQGTGITGILKSIDSEGVGANDVQRVALANFRGYLQGQHGRQEYRSLIRAGYSDKDAQKTVFMNLAGAGENQIHSKNKTMYHNDEFALHKAKGEYDTLKDQNQVMVTGVTQAGSYNPFAGLDGDMFSKQDRTREKTSEETTAGDVIKGVLMDGGYKPTIKTGYGYAELTKEQNAKAAALLPEGELATKMRAGTLTKQEKDKAYTMVKARLATLGNLKMSPTFSTIPESMNYGSYGKGEVGATKMLEAKKTGMVFIDPDDNTKIISGKNAEEQIFAPARAAAAKKGTGLDAEIHVSGQLNPWNHYGAAHNDSRFGDAMVVSVGGKQYIAGGYDQQRQHEVTVQQKGKLAAKGISYESISKLPNYINSLSTKALQNVGQAVQVLPGDHAPKFTVVMNTDGTYTLPQQIDPETGKPMRVEEPGIYIEAALNKYLQNQK